MHIEMLIILRGKLFFSFCRFNERGKIFSKEEVRAMQVGPGGLFFTGDATGEVKVWNWLPNEMPHS